MLWSSTRIAPVCKPEGHANHFKRNAHDARGLGIEYSVVQVWRCQYLKSKEEPRATAASAAKGGS